jgi:hypothetical protein
VKQWDEIKLSRMIYVDFKRCGETMPSKLEQAMERLQAVVERLEITSQAPSENAVSPDSSLMEAEILEIRNLVDKAMTLITKNTDTKAGDSS